MEEKKLLTGNEAIARGAYEAGVRVATAYPGTPSTEILENISKYPEIYSQWSVNEKVALEVASGSSIAGARTLAAMKHVGLNVAADPFMTISYTGVTGGLVLISADDPQLHSSQNEQDNRFYARFARVPMLEPSDSQEAKDFVGRALEISERFDTPVMLRTTTRISHSRSLVSISDRKEIPLKKYEKNCQKYVMIPAYGRIRHRSVLERWGRLIRFSDESSLNKIYIGKAGGGIKDIGIITSGVVFEYAKEVFPDMPILKLGMTAPLPEKAIRDFAEDKKTVIVIEELEPYLEEQLAAMGLKARVIGKEFFPLYGELNPLILGKLRDGMIGKGLFKGLDQSMNAGGTLKSRGSEETIEKIQEELPLRPPVLCAGCAHRPVFHILKKLKLKVMGDIGCYTLSVLPPLNSLDSCLCMGAGIGQALGMEKAEPAFKGKVVSVIGDSTFFHSGVGPLIDNVYNKGTGIIIILDNRITAMTGHQVHPGIGMTLMGEKTVAINPEDIARAAGVKDVEVVDPYDMENFEKVIRKHLARETLSVIVARQRCVLLDRKKKKKTEVYIDQEKCEKCGLCLKFGCPAIEYKDGSYTINQLQCSGCGVCVEICRKNAIICRELS
ncbi:MAG: indolepyruvate ferredoxin oxidoreductase subunit alpha [Actinomycetia bacterium]|nr:indolepyruvate ferredoxin oxidoreductase subunit alpha [Actinomycetes bacterium]